MRGLLDPDLRPGAGLDHAPDRNPARGQCRIASRGLFGSAAIEQPFRRHAKGMGIDPRLAGRQAAGAVLVLGIGRHRNADGVGGRLGGLVTGALARRPQPLGDLSIRNHDLPIVQFALAMSKCKMHHMTHVLSEHQ